MNGVFSISQISSITGASPSDCLVSYPGNSLVVMSCPSTEMQLVNSTALADWADYFLESYLCFYKINHFISLSTQPIFAFLQRIVMISFCTAIKRDLVSFFRFPLLSHIQSSHVRFP